MDSKKEQFKRLIDVFPRFYNDERIAMINKHTDPMPYRDFKHMIDFFINNYSVPPKPRDFEVYARSKGFFLAKKKPTTNCKACKNRGHFVGVDEKGYKFFFDCPLLCDWNTYYHGKGKKTPWHQDYRKRGFKLEHETRKKMTDEEIINAGYKLGILNLIKASYKGTKYESMVEGLEKKKTSENRSGELIAAKDILFPKIDGSDELPF